MSLYKPPRNREVEHTADGIQLIPTGIARIIIQNYHARIVGVKANGLPGPNQLCTVCAHPFVYFNIHRNVFACEACGVGLSLLGKAYKRIAAYRFVEGHVDLVYDISPAVPPMSSSRSVNVRTRRAVYASNSLRGLSQPVEEFRTAPSVWSNLFITDEEIAPPPITPRITF